MVSQCKPKLFKGLKRQDPWFGPHFNSQNTDFLVQSVIGWRAQKRRTVYRLHGKNAPNRRWTATKYQTTILRGVWWSRWIGELKFLLRRSWRAFQTTSVITISPLDSVSINLLCLTYLTARGPAAMVSWSCAQMSLAGLSLKRGNGGSYSAISVTNMDTNAGTDLPSDVQHKATSVPPSSVGDVMSLGMHIMNAHTTIKLCSSWQNYWCPPNITFATDNSGTRLRLLLLGETLVNCWIRR